MEWAKFQHKQSLPPQAESAVEQRAETAGVPMANDAVPNATPSAQGGATDVPTAKAQIAQAQRIHVKTDVLDITIDTHGGDIRDVKLLAYMATKDQTQPFHLMGDKGQMFYVAQTG